MANHARFRRGSGCYHCRSCRKLTRDTDGLSGSLQLCELCRVKAEAGNAVSDNCPTFHGDPWKLFAKLQTVAEVEALLEKVTAESAVDVGGEG